jgi:tRNA pseudouridine38-40 synthase
MNVEAIEESARAFLGEHDFFSFAATDPDLTTRNLLSNSSRDQEITSPTATTIRTVHASAWERRPTEAGDLLVYRIRGNGFLHHMVRNLVGTMLDVGRGHLKLEEIPAILAARSRSAAGPTAPARGLFLHSVEYDESKS